jgi:hypothetical protein
MGDNTEVPATTVAQTEEAQTTEAPATAAAQTETTNSDTTVLGDDKSTTAAAEDTTGGEPASGDTPGEDGQPSQDTYADFAIPEGMTLDESVLSEAAPLFKEMGLNQEQAQQLVDVYAKQVQAGMQQQIDDFNQLKNDWRDQSMNDNEFGGDKFDESVKIAQSAIAKYGTPEFKQLLEDHGMGNHPEVVRFMVKVGNTLKEDVPGTTGDNPAPAKDRASIMYPDS